MVLAACTGLTAALLAWFSSPAPHPLLTASGSAAAWTQTSDGPVGPGDRALLVSLRQDGLWEVPVGEQAQQMAADPGVRRIGGTVATDLGWLGGQVRAVAGRLDVPLPSQPTPDQQSWLVGIAGTAGPDYDRAMVTRLRRACETTLAALGQAGATTGNEQIRQLVAQATPVVSRHLDSLDGLAATPELAAARPATGSPLLIVAAVLLGLLALAGALGLTGLVRPIWPASGHALLWRGPAGWHGPGRWSVPGSGRRDPAAWRRSRGPWPRRPVGPPPPVELGPRGDRRPW
jgi:putative membrane protein